MARLTAEEAKGIWRYDPDTGYFFWLISPKYDVLIGDRAGYFDGKYWRLRYKKKNYKASRVAWLVMTGSWPLDQIDHINRVKADDSFCNLREATNQENCNNRKVRSDNSLGISGICGDRSGFSVYRRGNYVGHFKDLEQAKIARRLSMGV